MAAQYQILRMETLGTPPCVDGNGIPYVYGDPANAAVNAKILSMHLKEKLCVKAVVNDEWREREYQRFRTGEYRTLPWIKMDWWTSGMAYATHKDHFAHASLEKPGWIAYTKSPEDGMKDKQSLLRPGAYLNKYFEKALNVYGISERTMVEAFMTMYCPIEVKFATTNDDVIKVYAYLQTCMAGKRWPKNTHPATVYLAGDLQIAYIGDLEKGKVSARTLVWPEKKLHSRVYGDIAHLTQGLERLGYKWGAPIGAKLKRIQLYDPKEYHQGCFLVPYLDKKNQQGGGHLAVKDAGDHLIICQEGEVGSHHAGNADGTSGPYVARADEHPTYTCDRCEGEYRQLYDVYYQLGEDDDEENESSSWCQDCLENAWQCGWSGFWCTEDVPSVTVGGRSWSKRYAAMHAEACEGNGKLYSKGDLIKVIMDGKTKRLSLDWINKNIPGSVLRSGLTNYYYPRNDIVRVYNQYGEATWAAKSELTTRAFQCDGCDTHWLLETRLQTLNDDRLFCMNCDHTIRIKKPVPVSASRKKFEEERARRDLPQLPLQAAE